ncbi:MAG: SIS domain-containing protein [Parachlamydiales bacterium]|jgi:D-sedoheptulose 7-phosphate isomerase
MIINRLKELNDVINNTVCTARNEVLEFDKAFFLFKNYLINTRLKNGVVYVIGNGGSAGIASHFSIDLIKALKIPSNTLTDSNILTCLANDFGYENCFSEFLKVNLRKDDLLVSISSSGNSMNIINAANLANKKNVRIITFSGFDSSNKLRKIGDLNFWLDKKEYGLVEMGHFFILHSIVDLFNNINLNKEELTAYAQKS